MRVHGLLGDLALAAEQSGSDSLLLGYGSLSSYIAFWRNDLAAQELVLEDLAPIAEQGRATAAAIMEYRSCRGLLETLKGNPERGLQILAPLLRASALEQLPPDTWLQIHGNALYTMAPLGNREEIEQTAGMMREYTIAAGQHYQHAHLHFCQAIVSLVLDRPYKALLHADECRRRGDLCHSANAQRMSALIKGQALADLERIDEAIRHFEQWIPRWHEASYSIIEVQGCLEVSHLLLGRGRRNQARHYLDRARSLVARNEKIPVLHRPPDFVGQLAKQLAPSPGIRVSSPVRPVEITTMGSFSVRVRGRKIEEQHWHGRQAGKLLKAVISFGGCRVPTEPLAGLLWPDSDGDLAMNSFKVTLSRLRKIISSEAASTTQWLEVRQKQISLVESVVRIDARVFEDAMHKALHQPADEPRLATALDLYQGNFLEHDREAPWTMIRRNRLQELYIHGVFLLTDFLLRQQRHEERIFHLGRASAFDPYNEEIYVHLIRAYLDEGNRAKALTTCREALDFLAATLGTGPGVKLGRLAAMLQLS